MGNKCRGVGHLESALANHILLEEIWGPKNLVSAKNHGAMPGEVQFTEKLLPVVDFGLETSLKGSHTVRCTPVMLGQVT